MVSKSMILRLKARTDPRAMQVQMFSRYGVRNMQRREGKKTHIVDDLFFLGATKAFFEALIC